MTIMALLCLLSRLKANSCKNSFSWFVLLGILKKSTVISPSFALTCRSRPGNKNNWKGQGYQKKKKPQELGYKGVQDMTIIGDNCKF